MKKENLNSINQEIYEVFKKNNIKEHEMLKIYKNCYKDFELNYEISITIENKYFNMLRDIVWYNFEHNEEKNLTRWGSVFHNFMTMCDDSDEILYEKVSPLIGELNDIKSKISSNNVYKVMIVGNDELFENDVVNINFIDKRHNKLFVSDKINSKSLNCYVYEDIRRYEVDIIKLHSLITSLLTILRRAEMNQTNVSVNFV